MTDNWGTPRWLLDLIFDGRTFYDPCPANPDGLRAFDGLSDNWPTDRPIFINPPFSNIGPWAAKARSHRGEVVMLLPTYPNSPWWIQNVEGFRVILIGMTIPFIGKGKPPGFPVCVWRKP